MYWTTVRAEVSWAYRIDRFIAHENVGKHGPVAVGTDIV